MGSVSDELRYRGLTVDMRKGVLRRELPVEVKGNNVIGNTIYDKAGEVRVDDGMADAIGHNDLINDDMSLCNEVMTDTKVSTKKKYESKDIDSSTYIGSTDATQEILLTKNEMLIFSYLLNNQNRIVTRDELITDLWNNNEFVNDNTLTVNISRLRSKLREAGVENAIDTRKGQGYILQ
ncbi:MAG: winged helix-turn-helix transcriptional regulator [Lachnospiraceae bacterium]|nr:winged helix-turn-helix transcriptional regulator [Lachnospiraceae bacterium]